MGVTRNKVSIHEDGEGRGSVTVDGVELDATEYRVEGGVEQVTLVTVSFHAEVTLGSGPRAWIDRDKEKQADAVARGLGGVG
jgi:hypothetical protein